MYLRIDEYAVIDKALRKYVPDDDQSIVVMEELLKRHLKADESAKLKAREKRRNGRNGERI